MSLSSQPRYRTIFNHSQKKPNLLSSRPSFPSDPSSGPALTASPLCWLTSEQVCGLNSNTQHSLLLYFSKTGNIHRTAIGKLPFLLASVSVVEEVSLQKVKVTATQLSEQQRDSKLCVVSLARTLSSDLELIGKQRELVLGKVCIFPPVGVSIWLNITLAEASFINNRSLPTAVTQMTWAESRFYYLTNETLCQITLPVCDLFSEPQRISILLPTELELWILRTRFHRIIHLQRANVMEPMPWTTRVRRGLGFCAVTFQWRLPRDIEMLRNVALISLVVWLASSRAISCIRQLNAGTFVCLTSFLPGWLFRLPFFL